jgi:glucokinase
MTNKNNMVLAADIGGTHITAALVDLAHPGTLLSPVKRLPVDAGGSAGAIIDAWSRCLLAAKEMADVSMYCLAMPGPFDYSKGISQIKGQGKFDSLYGQNIKDLLASSLHTNSAAIFLENDAACFLHGEVFAGCARDGFEKVIGVTLGTGLGSAIYYRGKSRSADLWSLPFGGGIAEDFLSTRWFIRRYKELTGMEEKGVKQIAARAENDRVAKTIFTDFGKKLGAFLRCFQEKEGAEAVVIGGNIAQAYELFRVPLEETLKGFYPSLKLRTSVLGENAALFGAAGSWFQKDPRK